MMIITIVVAVIIIIIMSKFVVENINTWQWHTTVLWVNVGRWLCVAEWSTRPRWSAAFSRRRQVALSLVIRQWRSRVGRWLAQSSHSTAEQSTTTTTRPRRHKLSSQAVVPNKIMLQRTHITTLRSTQRWAVAAVWRHLAICSTLTNRLMSAWVQLAMSLSHQSSFTQLLNCTNLSTSPLIYTVVVIATVAISYQCWHVFVFLMLYFIAFPSLLCYFQAGWANSIAGQMLFVSVSVC